MSSVHRVREWLSGLGHGFRAAALAIVVGVLSAYGEPGVGFAPLFVLGLCALAWLAARARSALAAAFVGSAYGAGMFAVIMISSVEWGLIVPVALTVFGVALYALPLALWSYLAPRRWSGIALFVATVAAWALCMDLGDVVGFPSKCEALSAVAFAPMLVGGCRLVGVNIVSGVIIAGTVTCGAALARREKLSAHSMLDALRPLAASVGLLLAASGVAHLTAAPATASISVGVPQLAVPSRYFKLRQTLPQETDVLENHLSEQIQALGDVDLLAFTETYDGAFPLQVPRLRERFQNYAKIRSQAVLLTSYLVGKNGGGLNAVGAIDAQGRLVGVHRKVNLAPFGEVELERGAGFHPYQVLPNANVGTLICQEALLAEGPRALVRGGATLLVTTTSDLSFGSGILSFGHLAAARLRAIEVGRAMVWASNGGPSGAIDRWGAFERTSPFLEPLAAKMSVDSFDDRSPFLRSAVLWPPLCAGAFLILWLLARGSGEIPTLRAYTATSTLRGLLELAVALALAAIGAVASVAVVEARNGNPNRMRSDILALLGREPLDSEVPSLARFHTDTAHSAEGALAYYLDYYGDRRLPSAFAFETATLRALARDLAVVEKFPTREVQLDFSHPPRAGTLVRFKSGQFGVLSSNSWGEIGVFLSSQDSLTTLTYEQARVALEPVGLLPANDQAIE